MMFSAMVLMLLYSLEHPTNYDNFYIKNTCACVNGEYKPS